jgi:N-carbamoyl-L-amino-acid hydrolase
MARATVNRRTFVGQLGLVAAAPFVRVQPQEAPLRADGARVNAWLARFDAVGRTGGGINRVAYSDADLAGRTFTLGLFREAGLTPRIDAAGNILARLEGAEPSLPPIVIGSHVDSVTDGGNFDGPVGSFGAIEVARTLRERGARLRHPLDVVVWQNEEGGTIGSKLAIGALKPAELDAVARSGKTLREGIGLAGGSVDRLAEAVRTRGSVHAYLELHIEQGGTLERSNLRIGTVTGIVGLRWLDVTVDGFANHAGTTGMDQRQDAMLAAARFTIAVNDIVRAEPGRQVATVGRLVASPNTRNVIPGRVELTVDLRDLDAARLDHFETRLRQSAAEIGTATRTTFTVRKAVDSEPATSDSALMACVDRSAESLGLSRQPMPSGAGHDAQELARIAPMAMIFVPSVGGISHSPREFTKAEDVAHGVDVLLNAVVRADRL